MTIESIFIFVTTIVSYVFGKLAKKFKWIESKYIPYQNLIIGIISSVLYYSLIDNSNIENAIVTAFSGLIAGGFYDMTRTDKG